MTARRQEPRLAGSRRPMRPRSPPSSAVSPPHAITPQDALIYMMVMVSAADRDMHEVELRHLGRLLRELPLFEDFDQSRLMAVAKAAARLMSEIDGANKTLRLLSASIPARLRETAYVLACEMAVIDRKMPIEELRVMQRLRQCLQVDRLAATAIERSTLVRLVRA